MITGFNHNIKYKDCIYHVQTEDSGLRNPHVITHLFVGGNIIATKKADYAHLLNEPPDKQPEKIRKLMEEQHKAMLRSLINGKFDNALNTEGAHHLEGPAPLNVSAEVLARTGGSGNKARAEAPRPPAPAPTPARAAPPPAAAAAAAAPAPVLLTQPKPKVPVWPAPAQTPANDLAAAALSFLGSAAAGPGAPAPVFAAPAAEGGLAPEVLAARALTEAPVERPAGDTIFGEDLISEKSLDEVILSYLAEELE